MNVQGYSLAAIILFFLLCISQQVNSQTSFIWGKQFGSTLDEYAMNHVTDADGNIYVAGKTTGSIGGSNNGKYDAFVTKIDSLGNTLWNRQFGSDGDEDVLWLAVGDDGSVYVTGSTTGLLNDRKSGKEDIFVVSCNPKGELTWIRQIGTDSTDVARGIYVDDKGFVYLTGVTAGRMGATAYGKTDCFIVKLDRNGKDVAVLQFGTPGDDCGYSITGGRGSDILVCGTTWGDLKGVNKGFIDGFAGQFTDDLAPLGYYQFGSDGFDIAMILSPDSEGNLFVGGSTSGNFGGIQAGGGDAFLLKMNEKGDVLWNRQFGTPKNDGVRSIQIKNAASGNILVSGLINLPPAKAFIRMYQQDGAMLWERIFAAQGPGGDTSGKSATFGVNGCFYHMGLTGASLFGTLIGEHDVYLVKYQLDGMQ